MSDSIINEYEDYNADSQQEIIQEPLKELQNAWINEKFAPELLPHKENLVRFMMQCLSDMEEKLESLDKGDIRITIHTMELNRIRFLISSYLRTRLKKIENHVIQILKEHRSNLTSNSEDLYLTETELQFAKDYFRNFETLFRTVALQRMPEKFREFDYEKFSVDPNLQSQVFLTANKEINGIVIPEMDDPVNFEAGSQHIIQYGVVSEFVKSVRGGIQSCQDFKKKWRIIEEKDSLINGKGVFFASLIILTFLGLIAREILLVSRHPLFIADGPEILTVNKSIAQYPRNQTFNRGHIAVELRLDDRSEIVLRGRRKSAEEEAEDAPLTLEKLQPKMLGRRQKIVAYVQSGFERVVFSKPRMGSLCSAIVTDGERQIQVHIPFLDSREDAQRLTRGQQVVFEARLVEDRWSGLHLEAAHIDAFTVMESTLSENVLSAGSVPIKF